MATIKDIARIAGVSTSTVSHVVNKTRYVSPELVDRVEKAIRELDQLPNFIVKKSRPSVSASGTYILFLCSERHSIFQQLVAQQMELLLKDTEYSLITYCYDKDERKISIAKAHLLHNGELAGIAAFPDEQGRLDRDFFDASEAPAVLLGKGISDYTADLVQSDTFDGAYRATKHLIKNGHEQIAFLGSCQDFTAKRFSGYQKALEDYRIPLQKSLVFTNLTEKQEIFSALDDMMAAPVAPTAALAANSSLLNAFLVYISERNIAVPKDISIVSLNDFEWASLFTPPLTCVDRNPREFARTAVELLFLRMQREEGTGAANPKDAQNIVIPARLNVRASTCGIGRGPFGEKAENADSLLLSEPEREKIRKKNYTAAISFHYMGKAWMELQQKGIRKIFDDLNISLIATTDAHFDAGLQCRQLESIRYLEPDVIIAIPVDSVETSQAFRSIADSGKKLVLITNIPQGLTPADYVSCISVNEHSHGRNMGHGLGEYMMRHSLKHAGLIRHGDENFFATRQRDNAAEQVLSEEYPQIRICGAVNFRLEREVYRKTLEFIKHHPETEALYVSWDGPAMEALEALSTLNRTDIAVVTGDLDYPVAMNMAKGGMIKMLSAQCPYEQGEAIALAAANALLGRPAPSFIGIEPICVTPDNLLKSWNHVFKEEPPKELLQAFRQNPNHNAKQ